MTQKDAKVDEEPSTLEYCKGYSHFQSYVSAWISIITGIIASAFATIFIGFEWHRSMSFWCEQFTNIVLMSTTGASIYCSMLTMYREFHLNSPYRSKTVILLAIIGFSLSLTSAVQILFAS